MSAYGTHFIGVVAPTAGESPLHWSVRPFWHHMTVQLHDDGISVTAHDDLARTSAGLLPRQRTSANRRIEARSSRPRRAQLHEPDARAAPCRRRVMGRGRRGPMHDPNEAKPLDPAEAKPLADVLDQLTEIRDPGGTDEESDPEATPPGLAEAEANPADVLDQHRSVPLTGGRRLI